MSEYDSILKEKKKKEPPKESIKKKKRFPVVILSIVFIVILLIISYMVYYNTILTGDKIIANNFFKISQKYNVITENLFLDKIFSKNIEERIVIDENINYIFVKEENNYHLKTPSLDKYVNNKYDNINIKDILNNISRDKCIKKFYFDNKTPIVEINLILNKQELENLFKIKFKDNYEVIITSQNDALTNKIITMKLVINNKNTNNRKAIIIENDIIKLINNKNSYKFKIMINDNTFNVKVYKDDKLYSILTGTQILNSYRYTYQVIDKFYTINIITTKKVNDYPEYTYEFSSNIENVSSSLNLKIYDLSNNLNEVINYNDLIDEEKVKYDNDIKFLKDFINKYYNNI